MGTCQCSTLLIVAEFVCVQRQHQKQGAQTCAVQHKLSKLAHHAGLPMQRCTDTRGPPIYFLLPPLQQGSAESAQPSTTGRYQTPQLCQTVCAVAPRYPNVQCSSALKVCTRTHSIILITVLST
jgi:hypothetical protein